MTNALPFLVAAALLPLCASATHPDTPPTQKRSKAQAVLIQPGGVKYGDDPSMGPGFQGAVMRGDPGKAGSLFTIRGKFSDGFKVPPHWHPGDEGFVVLQGTFMLGMGDKWDASKAVALPQGSYAAIPKGMRHFAWAKGETVLELTGIGPFKTHWVNPADDPLKRPK